MKKETSNQFTEGLVSDLNPINTPNVVLTDNLNGTIITYNGNEHSLQNDMGNYELEYCKLNPNYIPVGIKEYGDILYIVSQNPLDNSVEIGSYPSPLMIVDPDKKDTSSELESIIKSQILDKGLEEENYTIMNENSNSIIFYGDDYKLNPGDEYCLQIEGESYPYKYETIEYQILDEDSNPHTITEKIKIDTDNRNQEFEHVAWTIPGWLTIKPTLPELGTAGINVKSFYVPKDQTENKSAYFSFDFRLNVNDKHLVNNGHLSDWCKGIDNKDLYDLRFRVFIEKKEGNEYKSIYNEPYIEFSISDTECSVEGFYLSKYGWGEWFGENRILWKNIFGKIDNVTEDDIIRVLMIPVIGEQEHGYKILYDNLKQDRLFDLSKISDDGWTIGSELYQFYTSTDDKFQYIYTNVDGPKISSFPVNLNCEIYDLNGNLILTHAFEDYSGIGENLLQIPFNSTFVKEDIYVIKFKFTKEELDSDNMFPSISRFLITSEVFNDFSNRLVYDKDISFGEWINNYWKHCTIKTDVKVEHSGKDSEKFDEVLYDNSTEPTEADKKYMSNEKYNTFFPEYNSGLSEEIVYRMGYSDEYNVENNVSVEHLKGPIWDAFGIENDFKYKDASSKEYKEIASSVIINRYSEAVCKYNKENSFLFTDVKEKNFIDNLSEYTGISDIGKITDYVVEISITVTGRNGDNYEDNNILNDRKSAYCLGRILKNGVPETEWMDYNNKEIERTLEGVIITNEKVKDKDPNWPVGTWRGEDGFLWWRAGRDAKHHTKEVCLFPKLLISWLFSTKKLPFVLVKINYTSAAPSANWKINTSVLGGEPISDFCFSWDDPNSASHTYVAFPRRIDEYGTEQKELLSDPESQYKTLVNWNPVLLPLCDHNGGDSYFRRMAEGVTFIDENPPIEQTSVYTLNIIDTKSFDALINVYHKIQFLNYSYKGIDFSDKKSKESLIQRFSHLNLVENNDIILGSIVDLEYNLIFSKTLETADFNNLNLWPHKDGFDQLNKNIIRWQSHARSDVNDWFVSGLYKSIQDKNIESIKGVYLKIDSDDKRLVNALSDSYLKTGQICLYAQDFNSGASGDTQPLLNDLFGNKNKWWMYAFSAPLLISTALNLAVTGFPWGFIIMSFCLGRQMENKNEDDTMGSILTTNGKSSIVTWTNKQAIGNSESKIYFVYGTNWKEVPTIRLDQYWDWIKYD